MRAYFEQPSQSVFGGMAVGDEIKVNGKAFTVNFVSAGMVGVTGPRGGQKTLLPSTCGRRFQISAWGRNERQWVDTLEIS